MREWCENETVNKIHRVKSALRIQTETETEPHKTLAYQNSTVLFVFFNIHISSSSGHGQGRCTEKLTAATSWWVQSLYYLLLNGLCKHWRKKERKKTKLKHSRQRVKCIHTRWHSAAFENLFRNQFQFQFCIKYFIFERANVCALCVAMQYAINLIWFCLCRAGAFYIYVRCRAFYLNALIPGKWRPKRKKKTKEKWHFWVKPNGLLRYRHKHRSCRDCEKQWLFGCSMFSCGGV